jgi:predicted ester cyclase
VGHQAFLDFHIEMFRTLPDLQVKVEAMISEWDHVVARWLLTATHRGKPVRYRGMTWIRYRDGKMVEGFDCWNATGFQRQLAGESMR